MYPLTLLSLLAFPCPSAPLPARAFHLGAPPSTLVLDEADEAAQYIAGLFQGELYDLVVREALGFLSKHPRHAALPLIRYRLASALFELDRSQEAIPHFRVLVARSEFEYLAEAQLRLGQCHLLNDEAAPAQKVLRAALASDQEYLKPTAAFFLGEAEFRLKDYANAREQYRQSLRGESAAAYHAHARRGLAWCDFIEEQWNTCQKECLRFLASAPQHELAGEVRFLLGDAAFQSEQHDKAETAWQSIEAGEWLPAALRGRAWIRSKRGEDREAAVFFARLLETDGRGPFAQEAAVQCAVHLLRSGNAQDALRVLELPAVGQSSEALYWRARAQRENGAPEAALALLDKGLRAQSDANDEWNGRLQTLRADLLFDLGRLDEAAESYRADGSEYGLHAGATASLNSGQPERALQLATEFLQRFPQSGYRRSTQLVRAEAHFALQQYAEALRDFQELEASAELDATGASNVQSRQAWCQYLLGDLKTAANSFARVPAAAAEAQEAAYMGGRAHSEAGQLEEAVERWRSYLTRFPDAERRPEVQLSLARLTGDADLLRQLLRENPHHESAPRALVELGEFESRAAQPQRAIQHYQDFLKRYAGHPLTGHVRYSLGWELRAVGNRQAAQEELRVFLKDEDDSELHTAALELALWLASEQQNPREADDLWQRFAPRCPDEGKLLEMGRLVAQTWKAAGDNQRSQAQLSALSKRLRSPEHSRALLLERAWLAVEMGSAKEADPLVRAAVAGNSMDPRVLELAFFAAEQSYEARDFSRAAELYALASVPANAELVDKALYKLGFAHLALDQPEQAAASFEQLVSRHGTSELYGESLYLAGEARFRHSELREAFAHLARFEANVRPHAVRPKALHRLCLVANRLKEFKVAQEASTELLTATPDFPQRAEVRYQQGLALLGLNRKRAARAAFQALLEDTQSSESDGLFSARARLELGRLDLEANDYENALSQFLKVSLLYVDGEEVREAKLLSAKVLEAQGEARLAIKNYRELQSSAPDSPQGQAAAQRLKELGA